MKAQGFRVSDTCVIRGTSFSSVITIFIPDSFAISASGGKIKADSLVVKTISLGVNSGIGVTYKNGNKTILPKVSYCALINSPTVIGGTGVYSTKASGGYKISFSADLYSGSSIIAVSEDLLGIANLEIKFNVVNKIEDCNKPDLAIKSISLEGMKNLTIQSNKDSKKVEINFVSDRSTNFKLTLFDVLGNLVYCDKMIVNPGNNTNTLDINSIGKGIYILDVSDETYHVSNKILINQ